MIRITEEARSYLEGLRRHRPGKRLRIYLSAG